MTRPNESLEQALAELAQRGIVADAEPLKADMCSQFANPYEWIREYVANAYDANATRVVISGAQCEGSIVITVADDGHGMDRQALLDFFTVFRSRKRGSDREVVGRHGVGKLSVAAIAGQRAFSVETSTGSEAWHASLGRILDAGPIRIERMRNVPKAGTRFDVAFDGETPLETILDGLEDVLRRSAAFLPIDVELRGTRHRPGVSLGGQAWTNGVAARRYCFTAGGVRSDAVLHLGSPARHEIYQSKVLVTSNHSLFSHGTADPLQVPHVCVRLDSPDFELPFGRHGLANEAVLGPITDYLREHALPDFMRGLVELWRERKLHASGVTPSALAEAACALLARDADWERVLGELPLFVDTDGRQHSLAALRRELADRRALFVLIEDQPGFDPAALGACVLARQQRAAAVEALRSVFGHELQELGADRSAVLELPPSATGALGHRELRLQEHLRFHPRLLEGPDSRSRAASQGRSEPAAKAELAATICEEAQKAQDELSQIEWRVGYLATSDGKKPVRDQRFILRGSAVVLNLNHPEVEELVTLAEHAPALAGHFGLALALTDGSQRFLEHLSPAAREDLILADAVAKAVMPDAAEESSEEPPIHDFSAIMEAIDLLGQPAARLSPSVPLWSLNRRPGSA